MRELYEMAYGKLASQWEQTAQISFTFAQAHCKNPRYENYNPFFAGKTGTEFSLENIDKIKKDFA